jgi:hypothetical protein
LESSLESVILACNQNFGCFWLSSPLQEAVLVLEYWLNLVEEDKAKSQKMNLHDKQVNGKKKMGVNSLKLVYRGRFLLFDHFV